MVGMWKRLSDEQRTLWKREAFMMNKQEVEIWVKTGNLPKFDELKYSDVPALV